MLNFISFGSGSSGNSYCLYTEKDAIMIDAGVGPRLLKKYFSEYGLSFARIRGIFVTHDHADHIKSVGWASFDHGIPVYATHRVHAGIGRNVSVRHKVPPGMARVVAPGSEVSVGGFSVTPLPVPHDSSENVGYTIRFGGMVFCLITDIGHVTEDIKGMIASADYLVIEANHDEEMLMQGRYPQHLKERIISSLGHLSNHDCGVAIAENATERLKKVWLCHLSEENNHPELARKTVAGVLRNYGIVAGKDFALEVLRRRHPSGAYEIG